MISCFLQLFLSTPVSLHDSRWRTVTHYQLQSTAKAGGALLLTAMPMLARHRSADRGPGLPPSHSACLRGGRTFLVRGHPPNFLWTAPSPQTCLCSFAMPSSRWSALCTCDRRTCKQIQDATLLHRFSYAHTYVYRARPFRRTCSAIVLSE